MIDLPATVFLRRLPVSPAPRHISSSIARSDKIPTAIAYAHVFGVRRSSGGTSDFVGRRCVLEIQDGSQITGSINNFAGFTDTQFTHVPKTMGLRIYVRNI